MGIRVDSAMESGAAIHPAYDSLIAKVIAWGRDRDEATARMLRALDEMVITGVPTTRDFHRALLRHPAWAETVPTTTFLERHPEVIPPPGEAPEQGEAPTSEPTPLIAEVNGRRFEVRLFGDPAQAQATSGGSRAPARPQQSAQRTAANGTALRSPIQGTVVRTAAAPGDAIEAGQLICVVEAMKMENDIVAHRAGTLTRLAASPGSAVRVGDVVAEIE
jgi:acetyl-CoA/propionyl-CoA carboxylase biotin carboxyl carrier protein